ncbi:superfamily II DNA/RNA helicase [Krasilnikovia cinnamomea]|uniref:Superfamily II DNA/RNA helicase n=1 Tax=Krasilnikovia cinnamomea TaxID=349313 RepID=A0A4Q7ZMN9_9ACTN|nr:DEAD/DEAH box helicase [Krasilnikovia cinnamomea]RZU51539.1 superfamily II DNA/RNA helicase [Krasilnikovia cinnamomea]
MAARRPYNTPSSSDVTFAELGLPAALIDALAANGVTRPFPIQAATLPDALSGRDVLGRGRTGSGKTYAFVLPLLARLAASRSPRKPGRPRALILAPTRELATQIAASMAPLAEALSLRTLTVFGGVGPNPQIAGLRKGVDVLVACPGRLADHVQAGHARLDAVEVTVLDEADHMADLGFLPVVRRLLEQTPRSGQRLLFSATLDAGVDVLVRQFLTKPVTHSVDSALSPVAAMSHHVLHVRDDERFGVLVDLAAAPGRTVVFTRTKRGAKTLTRRLAAAGVPAVELHGNLAQNARNRNLTAFSDGSATTLVATDIAARGIHVDDVNLVIHADPPVEHKAYLHRSGRTARAGAEGTVITLMTDSQVSEVRDLIRKAGIAAATTRVRPDSPKLAELAPGERTFVAPPVAEPAAAEAPRHARSARTGARRPAQARTAQPRTAQTRTGQSHTAQPRTAQSHAAQSHTAQARTAQSRTASGRGRSGAPAPAPRSGSGRGDAATAVAPAARHSGASAFSARTRVGGRRGGR